MPWKKRGAVAGSTRLDELIWHWGMAYRIWAADGTWYARRNGHGEIMQATDPERLSFMIRDDYLAGLARPGSSPLTACSARTFRPGFQSRCVSGAGRRWYSRHRG